MPSMYSSFLLVSMPSWTLEHGRFRNGPIGAQPIYIGRAGRPILPITAAARLSYRELQVSTITNAWWSPATSSRISGPEILQLARPHRRHHVPELCYLQAWRKTVPAILARCLDLRDSLNFNPPQFRLRLGPSLRF